MRSFRMVFRTLLFMSMLVFGQGILAEDPPTSRDQANAFFEMHEGRWRGKVQSTIGEAEINKVDEEALNYLDFHYVKKNGLLTMRNYGPRSGGRGFSHYDSIKKCIRSINHGVGGVVTYHEITARGKSWIRTSKQVFPDGSTREFYSTINFTDNNQAIEIEINHVEGPEGLQAVISSQTNVWRRIE